MRIKLCLCYLWLTLLSFGLHAQSKIVLETDFDGNVVSGSKKELIQKIRAGHEVRVGYQLDFNHDKVSDFDHWLPAEFITILGEDVFTQIRNINLQAPNLDAPQIDIIPVNTMWTAVLGTNSLLKNRFVYPKLEYERDENGQPIVTEQVEKELKKREVTTWKVATFWAVDND